MFLPADPLGVQRLPSQAEAAAEAAAQEGVVQEEMVEPGAMGARLVQEARALQEVPQSQIPAEAVVVAELEALPLCLELPEPAAPEVPASSPSTGSRRVRDRLGRQEQAHLYTNLVERSRATFTRAGPPSWQPSMPSQGFELCSWIPRSRQPQFRPAHGLQTMCSSTERCRPLD